MTPEEEIECLQSDLKSTQDRLANVENDLKLRDALLIEKNIDLQNQGDRLTKALSDIETITEDRNQYKSANAALQEAIHKATASIPEMQQVRLFALQQMEETLVASIRSIFAGMIAEAKGQ